MHPKLVKQARKVFTVLYDRAPCEQGTMHCGIVKLVAAGAAGRCVRVCAYTHKQLWWLYRQIAVVFGSICTWGLVVTCIYCWSVSLTTSEYVM